MAKTNTLLSKLVLRNDNTANWATSDVVLLKGEVGVELLANGERKLKIGDGQHLWSELQYVTATPTEIDNDLADKNVIEVVKVNGVALPITDLTVDVPVPTKVSDIDNDLGFISSYVDTTYELGTSKSSADGAVTVSLVGDNGTTSNIDAGNFIIDGEGYTAVTTDANGKVIVTGSTRPVKVDGVQKLASDSATALDLVSGNNVSLTETNGAITIDAVDTTYVDMVGASSGDAGESGLVPAPDAGDNVKFLRGDGAWAIPTDTTYDDMVGATASAAGQHGLVPAPSAGNDDEFLRGDGTWSTPLNTTYSFSGTTDGFDVTPTTNGTTGTTQEVRLTHVNAALIQGVLSIDNIPNTAKERIYTVSNDTERLTLTTAQVQPGDTVKVTGTSKMYMVKSLPESGDTYNSESYFEEYTASADWSAITNKPTTYNGYGLSVSNGLTGDGTGSIGLANSGVQSGTYGPSADVTGSNGTTIKVPKITIDTYGRVTLAGDYTYTSVDTTYEVMHGATAIANGDSGLVPAPESAERDKFLRGDGTWATPINTDTLVTTTPAAETKAYITGTTTSTESTGTLNFDTGVYLSTEAGTLVATKFSGMLEGNAATATKFAATKNFSITGGATAAAVAFDGSDNVVLNVTSLDAALLNISSEDTLVLNGGTATA